MSTVVQDIRYAFRQMRLSPGFTLIAILTLVIGIGATTGIFTLNPLDHAEVATGR